MVDWVGLASYDNDVSRKMRREGAWEAFPPACFRRRVRISFWQSQSGQEIKVRLLGETL